MVSSEAESRARLKRMSQSLSLEMKQEGKPRRQQRLKKKVETAHGSALSAVRFSAKLDLEPSLSSVLTSQSAPDEVPEVDEEESWLVVWGSTSSHTKNSGGRPSYQKVSVKSRAVPWRVPGISSVAAIMCGDGASLVIDADGECAALLPECPEKKRVIRLRAQGTVDSVAVGREHALLIDTRGCLWQVDLVRRRNFESPSRVALSHLEAAVVACGVAHCLVATRCGALFAWGEASAGQLGQGDAPDALKTPRGGKLKPRRVWLQDMSGHVSLASSEAGAVACGAHHSAAVSTDGSLWTWGWTEHGRLGRGDVFDASLSDDGKASGSPARVAVFDSGDTHASPESNIFIRAVTCGCAHTAALSARGHVYACGWNEHGQAAGHISAAALPIPTRVQLPLHFNAIQLAAGLAHTVALDDKGQAMAWGFGEDGQLGQGTEASSTEPVLIASGTPLAAISAAGTRTAGIACRLENAPNALAAALRKRQAQRRAAPAAAVMIQKRVRGIDSRYKKRNAMRRHASLAADILRVNDWRELLGFLREYREAFKLSVFPCDLQLVKTAKAKISELEDLEASNAIVSALILLTKLGFDQMSLVSLRLHMSELEKKVSDKSLLTEVQHRLQIRAVTLVQSMLRGRILSKALVVERKTAVHRLTRVLNTYFGHRREKRVARENENKRHKSCQALQAASRGRATRKRLIKEAAARVERYNIESRSVVRLQCLARRVSAKKKRRKRAKHKAKTLRLQAERERVVEKEREAQLAERQRKLSEARQRRNSHDARLAREAARLAARYLADLAKKEADDAANAAAQAMEALKKMKYQRDRERLLRKAQRRKAEAAALAASQKQQEHETTRDDADDSHEQNSFYQDEQIEEKQENNFEDSPPARAQEEVPSSSNFAQYANSLKRSDQRPSSENLLPDDLEREADPACLAANKDPGTRPRPLRFRSVDEWAPQSL